MSQATSESHVDQILERDATFSRQTEALLREQVLTGALPAGSRLNEVELATALGISRGPLREAIQKLAGEGLLSVKSHRGAYVRQITAPEIVELYEMRTALELYAVDLVTERASDPDLDELVTMLEARVPNSDDEGRGPYLGDLDFHQQLISLARNDTMAVACLRLNRQLYLALSHSPHDHARAQHAIDEHVEIARSLRARDADQAKALIVVHSRVSRDNTIQVLEQE